MARRVHLPGVLSLWWVADGEGALDVHRVWPAEFSDGRDDLSPDPDATFDLVRGDLVHHVAEERDVCAVVLQRVPGFGS